jgi:hypothetical protein
LYDRLTGHLPFSTHCCTTSSFQVGDNTDTTTMYAAIHC